MGRTVNYLKGSVLLEAEGKFPERFVNICAENGVDFWDLERIDEEKFSVRVHSSGYRTLQQLDLPFKISEKKKLGMPFAVKKFKKRYALIFVLLLCVIGIWEMSRHIWRIEVTGNIEVPTERILAVLEELGVGIGTRTDDVDTYSLRNSALLRIEELSWLSVNMHGSRAEVIVREREQKPEIVPISEPAETVASKAGLIVKLRVLSGAGCVSVGQTVAQGDVLVSGQLQNTLGEERSVHAMAEVYARTWYTLKAELPLQYTEKLYTGQEKTKRSLLIGKQRINLYFNSGISYDMCDKITTVTQADVFGLMALPVQFVSETYREYTAVAGELSESEAKLKLKESLMSELESACEGDILSTAIDYKVSDGVMTATLYAECMENIAQTVKTEG